jgi:hypothetical protein
VDAQRGPPDKLDAPRAERKRRAHAA